jgi:hypothetical protein
MAFGAVVLWGSREWGEIDPRLVARLERQLVRLGEGDDPRRVRILATLAEELYFDDTAPAGWRYAQQAMEMARRLADAESIGIAVSGYLLSALANDFLSESTAVIEELLGAADLALGPDVKAVLRLNLLT